MNNQSRKDELNAVILEDNPADVELVLHQLKRSGFTVNARVASNESEFQRLVETPCEMIFADYSLPQYSAPQALQFIQERNLDIPFIVISGSIGEEIAVDMIKRGATDYFLKDRLIRLGTAVNKALDDRERRSAQLAAESAYQRSETRYNSLFHNSPMVMLFVHPAQGTIVDANQAAAQFYNLPKDKLVGEQLARFDVQPSGLSRLLSQDAKSSQIKTFQSQQQLTDGSLRAVEVSGCRIPAEEGELLFVTITDVSQILLINHIFQNMGEPLIVIDQKYQVVTANQAYCDLLGCRMESIEGMPHQQLYESSAIISMNGDHYCLAQEAFRTGERQNSVHCFQDEKKEPCYWEISAFPIQDKSGNISMVIEFINDITLRRQLEEQLRQSQKMEAIGSLSGGIAHDFNNILSVIMGNASLLQRKIEPGGPFSKYVESVLTATEKAAALTKGLLAFSRKQVLDPVVVDLNATIVGMAELLERLIGENIDFQLNLSPREFNLLADKSQIEQIIMNLVINARDAMERGGELRIETRIACPSAELVGDILHLSQEGYVLMAVADSGTGMDKSTMARMFEPFFTSKGVGKGTGLGLSTVYGIIKQHNGYIFCDSTPGEGTMFKVYLPLTKINPGKPIDIAALETGGKESILIVEDDKNVRQLVREILRAAGYETVEAEDADQAIALFQQQAARIDLVLLDVIMPGKNGKQLLDILKKIKPEILAIFMSGHADDIILRTGLNGHQLHFLPKPLLPGELLIKVRTVLDGTR